MIASSELEVYGLWVFSIPGLSQRGKFLHGSALHPHLILTQSKSSPGQGAAPALALMAMRVSQDMGTPRDSWEWANHCRLWSFTWKTRPFAISDQLIVLTSLKVRNEDAFFQSRTISINLWQIGIPDPQYPAEQLVILFVQAPQEKGNGSQHHQCHKNSQSYKPTVWHWKGRTEIVIKQI